MASEYHDNNVAMTTVRGVGVAFINNGTGPDTPAAQDGLANLPPPPFSQYTYYVITVLVRIILNGSISFIGMVTNVINIAVFYRQGFFSHSSVVNLTCLSVSDLLSCVFYFWGTVCGILEYFGDTSNWSWDVHWFFVHFSGRPYNTNTIITCWIAAFLSFERAMSVTFPFRAKSLFTPKRSLAVMIFIYISTLLTNIPNLVNKYLIWETDPVTNRTFLTGIPLPWMTREIQIIYFYTFPVTLRTFSVVIVIVCNLIIYWKVYLSHKFRQASAAAGTKKPQHDSASPTVNTSEHDGAAESKDVNSKSDKTSTSAASAVSKEMRLVRMISLISVIFMASYIPSVLHVILGYIVWQEYVDYHTWVDFVVFYSVCTLQLASASTNLIIYYKMSARFKEEFRLLFFKSTK